MNAPAAPSGLTDVPHWVIAELDAHGEIDSHAAMCVRFTVDALVAAGAAAIVIDLRDVAAIDAEGMKLLTYADGVCRAGGVHLGLLIGVGVQPDALTGALIRAGLNPQARPPQRPIAAPERVRPERRLPALQWVTRTGPG